MSDAMDKQTYLRKFSRAYKVAALWSSTDYNGEPLDKGRDRDDIHGDAHEAMDKDCAAFVDEQWEDLRGLDPEQCGHDFWLTRNGHGAGFWDRGLGDVGERLTAACGWRTKYPEVELYVGDDNMIHQ